MNAERAYIEGFVKRASEYGFSEQEAVSILKEAKILDLEDVEENMGAFLREKNQLSDAQKGIEDAYANSFSLRHPFLTGIPTIGIAPGIAKGRALRKLTAKLRREHPELDDRANARLKDRMPIETVDRVGGTAAQLMLLHSMLKDN